jgi:hypothetical protein
MKTTKLTVLFFALIAAAGGGAVGPDSLSGAAKAALPAYDSLDPANRKLTNDAVAYHESLMAPLSDFRKANYDYIHTVTRMRKARTVEKKRQELIKVVQSNKDFIKNYIPFRNDPTLRDELVRYLDIVYIVLKQDFDKILDMEDIAAQSYDQAEAHQLAIDLAIRKMNASFDVLKNAEKEFFNKYHITVNHEKNELSLKIEKASKAMEYYDTLYRVFFKVNKEDNYAREVIAARDVAGLEQHASTLVSFAEYGLEQLKQEKGYEGDDKLLSTEIKMLEFYREEGKTTCPANVDFYIKTDNFQKAQKKINSLKPADRKKEDIDHYNEEVNIFNKAVKEINKMNKTSYKMHKKIIKSWNREVEKFFKKHS